MKKILYSVLGLGALLATSCSMDLEPVGSILEKDAITGINDCEMFRNGFYGQMRTLTTGSYVYNTAIQMDDFIGTIINGNRLGTLNNGTILSNDGGIEGNWSGLYGGIASVNFFLNRTEGISFDGDGRTDKEIAADELAYSRYVAEARFTRAFFYWWLLDHFCPAYSDATKDLRLGLALVTKYNPTSDKSTYPGRSTLAETYKFIEDDLEAAYNGLKKYEESLSTTEKAALIKPMAEYVCTWTVRALQARVALLKGDYTAARDYAEEVISSNIYRLSTRDKYEAMWTVDTNDEIIFRPISSSQELGIGSTGGAWLSSAQYVADYIPVPYVAVSGSSSETSLYERLDIRYSSFIGKRTLLVDGVFVDAPAFVKYPGNPSLQVTSTNNLMNMPKPFRMSELYLISAEASYELGDPGKANTRLDDIRKNRISRYKTKSYSGTELRDEIRLERHRELIAEGFRMSDLRRWQIGFNRADVVYPTYPQAGDITVAAGRSVVYQPDDYRYVWPIPSSELQVNPQMAGQQNPGY